MEIPNDIRKLYRHWNYHLANNKETYKTYNPKDKKLFKDISWFIKERINIWEKKITNKNPPFTKDRILSKYRFCNILREFDRQTIEFHKMLNPYRKDFSFWLLNMFYFRMVANTDTIKKVGLISFNKKENEDFYKRLMNSPRPRFGTPYIFPISTIMRSDTPTRELFISKYLPTIMNTVADEIKTWDKLSIYEGVERITKLFKFNLNFLWTEVLIDVAYQFPEHINLFDEFPIGPGSIPTLKRLDKKIKPSLLVKNLAETYFDTGLTINKRKIRLSAENWEGIGCEYRKYTNLKSGKGRKRIYKK